MIHLLETATLTAAKELYLAGQPHELMAVGTNPELASFGQPVDTRYPDGGNLYLRVSKTGAMSWLFMYVKNGKRHERGIGSFTGEGRAAVVSLKQARAKASQLRIDIDKPNFLHTEKARAASTTFTSVTFADMFKIHADACIKGNKWIRGEKERKHWQGMLDKNATALLAMPLDDIQTSDVVKVLTPLWPSRGAEVLDTRIRAILNRAEGQGYFKGRKNPASKVAIKAHLDGKHVTESHAPLPFAQMPGFLATLIAGGSVDQLGLAFIALTAVRSSEARLALRSEIVGDRWTIPADRMGKSTKGGGPAKEHVVPLSKQALAIIARLPVVEGNPYLFPGENGGPLVVTAFDKIIEDMGLRGVTTVHGLRSTFDTYMSQLQQPDDRRADLRSADDWLLPRPRPQGHRGRLPPRRPTSPGAAS